VKILVTGGAGFIGSHIVDALVKGGHEVAVVDDLSMGKREQVHPSARFYRVDIRDRQALEEVFRTERPEVVNHHAAQADLRRSMSEPSFDASVNIVGSLNLLEFSLTHKVRKFINISSGGAVYGEPQRLPVNERHPIHPASVYGVSKYAVEQYLRLFDGFGLDYTILRYANVYGPRQNPAGEAGVVAIFSRQMLAGERPTIFGDGTKTRDYVYVDDIVGANLLAMAEKRASSGRSYNVGLGREVSDRQIFELVRKAVGATVEPILASKRPGEIDRICLDASLAKSELGWEPTIFLEEGISRTVAFYQAEVTHRARESR
jgi:UDP-glucose 4-epimerase